MTVCAPWWSSLSAGTLAQVKFEQAKFLLKSKNDFKEAAIGLSELNMEIEQLLKMVRPLRICGAVAAKRTS